MAATYFTLDDQVFRPTELARGPWAPDACHAGPPTGLLGRAAEQAVPDQQLVRLTVDLTRPVPHAGFTIEAEVLRSGRSVSTVALRLLGLDGVELVTARALLQAATELGELPTTPFDRPDLDASVPGRFAVERAFHGLTSFADSIEVRYPPGEPTGPGPKRMWMRALPLLPDEDPSPFQRICPLADCGNAVSSPVALPPAVSFMNTDLTVALHRPPVGEWFGTDSVSRWERSGVGLSDSLLFDRLGPVGRATQTLLIRPLSDTPDGQTRQG